MDKVIMSHGGEQDEGDIMDRNKLTQQSCKVKGEEDGKYRGE